MYTDDSKNIINVIRSAEQNNQNLLIFIDTPGGDLVSSDEICSALRTYRLIAAKNHDPRTITCVVDQMAQSAGTMIALSCDTLHMSDFAVLGPTDPQATILFDEYDYDISCQLYDDSRFHLGECTTENLVAKDRKNSYVANINMFKTLKQYELADVPTQKKMLRAFCENSVPHHRSYNSFDLEQIGIKVNPLEKIHVELFSLLDGYKQSYESYIGK